MGFGVEGWLLLAGVLMITAGGGGFILERVMRRATGDAAAESMPGVRWSRALQRLAPLGLLVGVVACVIAAYKGSFGDMASAMVFNPLSFLADLRSDGKAIGCVSGVCAKFCCESLFDPDEKWKDCSSKCDGRQAKPVGSRTGEDCQYSNREMFCDLSKVPGLGKSTMTGAVCNYDDHFGPITCTCCQGTDAARTRWWDCNSRCESLPHLDGVRTAEAVCASLKTLECASTSDTSTSVNTTRSQLG